MTNPANLNRAELAQTSLLPAGEPDAANAATADNTAAYNAQDITRAAQVALWLREHDQSRSWLAKKTGIAVSYRILRTQIKDNVA